MKSYYIFSNGILKRKENTIVFETSNNERKFIPVENVDQIFVFGEVDFNNKFLNFVAQHEICIHVFNYYGYYSGSFYPRQTNVSGYLLINQVKHYLEKDKRLNLAKKIVEAAIHNLKRNIEKRKDLQQKVKDITTIQTRINSASSIEELMSIEAHARKIYYSCFEAITGWEFGQRTVQPPGNELNALISFGNSLVYCTLLKEIYTTPLNPTISYLHEPQQRRFSLCLDMAEIFKPILSDRIVFRVINNQMITKKDFNESLGGIYLSETARKVFIEEFDKQLETTLLHRKLKKRVKYKTLIKLEFYKLIKHLLDEKEYSPLKVWW